MIESTLAKAADLIWSFPVVALCLLGAVFFTFQLGFVQFRGFPHAIALLTGRYDKADETGTLSHFQALMAALSGTIGIGNIGGVAIAIAMGGPGAVLWMWVLGLFAMATKFVECTLATHYRTVDPETGETRGGPMHYIEQGLGPRALPLAKFYAITVAVAGFGFACMFQSNQAASALEAGLAIPTWVTGISMVVLGGVTIIGGIKRIGATAARVVPLMCGVYLLGAAVICVMHADRVLGVFALIIEDGFSARAVLGGSVTAVILAGVRRAVFSNEAGLGSAGMAHATVKTDHPVREGVVASLGPFIDTVVVSTATALVILLGGYYGTQADTATHVIVAQSATPLPDDRFAVDIPRADLADAEGIRIDHALSSGAFKAELVVADETVTSAGSGELSGSLPPLRGCELAQSTRRACTLEIPEALRTGDHTAGDAAAVTLVLTPLPGPMAGSLHGVELVRSVKGIALTAQAFEDDLPGFGAWFIPIAGFFFAFSTMVTWSFYGETATVYLVGRRGIQLYRFVFVALAYVGATQNLGVVISFSDAMVGLLVIPNSIALIWLSPRVKAWSKAYFAELRAGAFDSTRTP